MTESGAADPPGTGRGWRYPAKALKGDYARAGLGLALTGTPLLFAAPSTAIFVIFGGLAALFLVFGLRTWARHMTVVEVTETEISAGGPRFISGRISDRVTLAWKDVSAVKLGYFSTARDRTEGWMHLKLQGGGKTLRLESDLEGFTTVAARAATAATANGLPLNAATLNNFKALGITVETAETAEPAETVR